MAKARRTVTEKVKEEVLKDLLGEEEERDLEEQADLDEFFQEVGGGATCVDIFEVLDGAERGYIKRVDWAQLKENPLEMIKKKFGCRKYFLRFRGADRRILRSKVVNIVADTPSLTPGVTPPNAPNSNDSDSKFMRDVLLALIAKQGPAAPAFDMGAIMTGIGTLMAAMKQPSADPAAMLTAVSAAFSTVRGSAQDGNGLSMAKTIVELAAAIGGGGNGKEDNWLTVVKDVGKEVVNKLPLAALMPAPAAAPQPEQPAPAERVVSPVVSPVVVTTPQPAAPAAPAPGPPDMRNPQTIVELIRVGLAYLKQKAAKPDPDGNLFNLAIDWIMENSEEPQWAAILGTIREGATFEQLLQFDVEIANIPPLREWFKRLYDELHAEIFNAMDTRRARGNSDNPASDGPGKPAGGDGPGSTKSSS